jgi:hypothetical protein
MTEGLAFWTDDGIPGIQVSALFSLSIPSLLLLTLSYDVPHVRALELSSRLSTRALPLVELTHRRNIGHPSLLVVIEIQSESPLAHYTPGDCF